MQILIEKLKIRLLLEQKREYIGGTIANSVSFFLAVLSLVITLKEKGHITGIVDWSLVAICILTGAVSIKMLFRDLFKNYTHEQLYDDIVKLNVITHPFSLVIIRNEFEKRPNKFLLRMIHAGTVGCYHTIKPLLMMWSICANVYPRTWTWMQT